MSDIIKIPLDHILPNPKQVRKTFRRIEELARSIAQYGLLHNLVVIPHTEPGYYELVAGERRYRALTLLAKDGRLPSIEINCLVISGEGAFENVVENLAREDVPLWEVGRTYVGFYDSGFTQAQIATRIGKSQGHVSTAMILARGLAPAVVVRLAQLPPNTIPIQRLLRISTLVNEEDEPNEEAQSHLFQKMLDSPTRRGRRAARPRTQKEALWLRFQRLRQGKVGNRIDPVYQTFLDSLVKYLAGETKGLAP
ncbi:MAG: ParB/RepB/Spo0J family partition protein [Polyangiaceae bacterium]